MTIAPLQLKIYNFYNELYRFADNNRTIFIDNDEKNFFRRCREIWNNITELIGIKTPEILLKLIQIMMMINLLR